MHADVIQVAWAASDTRVASSWAAKRSSLTAVQPTFTGGGGAVYSPAPSNGGLSKGAKIGIGVGVPIAVLALLALLILFILSRRRKRRRAPNDSNIGPWTETGLATPGVMPSEKGNENKDGYHHNAGTEEGKAAELYSPPPPAAEMDAVAGGMGELPGQEGRVELGTSGTRKRKPVPSP